jgi:spore germination protein YaaH
MRSLLLCALALLLGTRVARAERCGWIAASDADGVATFASRPTFFDAIHPKWYELAAGRLRALPGADDPRVVATAQRHGVALIPLVASMPRDRDALRAVLRDPARRSAHVAALVALAVEHRYAGLDLDYEGLWGADDRAALAAFVAEIARAMHAAGKSVSFAVAAQVGTKAGDKPGVPWDYALLAAHADHVHLMAYDLHTVGTHAGPIAPLGWVEAVIAHAAATGRPERFVLGLASYGVTPTWSTGADRAAALCRGRIDVTDDHMATCSRSRHRAGRAPHCTTAHGLLHYEDTASLEAKVRAARRAGLGGVTYWHLGDEPDGFFAMIARHY